MDKELLLQKVHDRRIAQAASSTRLQLACRWLDRGIRTWLGEHLVERGLLVEASRVRALAAVDATNIDDVRAFLIGMREVMTRDRRADLALLALITALGHLSEARAAAELQLVADWTLRAAAALEKRAEELALQVDDMGGLTDA